MTDNTNEIEQRKRKLKELEEQKKQKDNKAGEQYEVGITALEDEMGEKRKDLGKHFGADMSTSFVSNNVNRFAKGTTNKTRSRVEPKDHPLVKVENFAMHDQDSNVANEALAKNGLTKDSFNYDERRVGHRQVLIKSDKVNGVARTTTVVGAAQLGYTPDYVNITMTDPKTKTSYSHSVGTVYIDRAGAEATPEEVNAAVKRLKSVLPKNSALLNESSALKKLIEEGKGVRVETVRVTDSDGNVHTQAILKAVGNDGTPVKGGSVLVATQLNDKGGNLDSSSLRTYDADTLRKKGAKVIDESKETSMASPPDQDTLDALSDDRIMQAVAQLKAEGRDYNAPSPSIDGLAERSGASTASVPSKKRGTAEGIA